MEKIDVALRAFRIIQQFVSDQGNKIHSETDARVQIIDRILFDVLGWSREELETEPPTPSGYIDYLLKSGGRRVFIVEANRTSDSLVSTRRPGLAYYKVGGAALRDAEDGINQAASYCSEKSVPFAALTNGHAWIGFRPMRIDGISFRDGIAAVFPNLEAVEARFAEFHDLFSEEGVVRRLYNVFLDREEGGALSTIEVMNRAIPEQDIYLMRKTQLSRDLETLFEEFFLNITGENDRDLLLHCFVETAESHEAERNLSKISRDLINYIQELRSDTGQELRCEIEASY